MEARVPDHQGAPRPVEHGNGQAHIPSTRDRIQAAALSAASRAHGHALRTFWSIVDSHTQNVRRDAVLGILVIILAMVITVLCANAANYLDETRAPVYDLMDRLYDPDCITPPPFLHASSPPHLRPYLVLHIPPPPFPHLLPSKSTVDSAYRKALPCWGPEQARRHPSLGDKELRQIWDMLEDARDKLLAGVVGTYGWRYEDQWQQIELHESPRWTTGGMNMSAIKALGLPHYAPDCPQCTLESALWIALASPLTFPSHLPLQPTTLEDLSQTCPPCHVGTALQRWEFWIGPIDFSYLPPFLKFRGLQNNKTRLPPRGTAPFWEEPAWNPIRSQPTLAYDLCRLLWKYLRLAIIHPHNHLDNTHSSSAKQQLPTMSTLFQTHILVPWARQSSSWVDFLAFNERREEMTKDDKKRGIRELWFNLDDFDNNDPDLDDERRHARTLRDRESCEGNDEYIIRKGLVPPAEDSEGNSNNWDDDEVVIERNLEGEL